LALELAHLNYQFQESLHSRKFFFVSSNFILTFSVFAELKELAHQQPQQIREKSFALKDEPQRVVECKTI
jgi:hypothetical protein